MKTVWQKILLILGVICVAVGMAGMVLPVLPTVPFLLLAAACFDRSSPRFHQKLVSHVHFGPLIRDFYAGRGIPRRAKIISVVMIWLSGGFSLLVIPHQGMKLALAITLAAVSVYLLRLKSSDRIFPEAEDSAIPEENIHREES